MEFCQYFGFIHCHGRGFAGGKNAETASVSTVESDSTWALSDLTRSICCEQWLQPRSCIGNTTGGQTEVVIVRVLLGGDIATQ